MGGIVSQYAFLPPESSYNESLEGLIWIPSNLGKDEQIPAVLHSRKNARFTLLFSHGNAEDIGQMQDWLAYVADEFNISIICYDYRGYGLHKGEPSEASCFADVESVFSFLVKEKQIPQEKIVLFGRSLGSGPTTHLASMLWEQERAKHKGPWYLPSVFCGLNKTDSGGEVEKPIAGVMLQSPIASCIRVVSNTLAVLPIDMFVNIKKIDKIGSPTIIIHGTMDGVVPYVHGQDLFNKAGTPYKFVSLEGAGHNDIECDFRDELFAAWADFFEYLEGVDNRKDDDGEKERVMTKDGRGSDNEDGEKESD